MERSFATVSLVRGTPPGRTGSRGKGKIGDMGCLRKRIVAQFSEETVWSLGSAL